MMTGVSSQNRFYCECIVSIEPKSLREYLTDWSANLATTIRAACSMPLVSDDERAEADRRIDPDFIGWVHNDPMVAWSLAQPTTEVRLFLLLSG
jgi:hypothetical protein